MKSFTTSLHHKLDRANVLQSLGNSNLVLSVKPITDKKTNKGRSFNFAAIPDGVQISKATKALNNLYRRTISVLQVNDTPSSAYLVQRSRPFRNAFVNKGEVDQTKW